MSAYENYERTSAGYDATRRPVGIEPTLAWLARIAPLAGLSILDTGCGTGQFVQALLPHVARIAGVDRSPGMLAVARAKLDGDERVGLARASIDELPFAEGHFDGAVVNQVLHHLPKDDLLRADDWTRLRAVFADLRRVLRDGATLVINTCSQDQLQRAYWYHRLMPQRIIDDMRDRYAPLGVVAELLLAVGFTEIDQHAVVDEVIQGPRYFDPQGPLDPTWRGGDSMWSLLTDAELAAALDRVRQLDAAGRLEAWMAEMDAPREGLGQVTLIAAR